MKAAFFGQFLVDEAIISFKQLADAIKLQSDSNILIGQLILEKGMLSQSQVREILQLQKKEDVYFGVAAVELGFLTQEQIDELLKEQKERHILVGEALVQLGHLQKQKLEEALLAFEEQQNKSKEQNNKLCQENFKNEELFIEQFLIYTIKLLVRVGGILAKVDYYEFIEKEIEVKPVAVEMSFKDQEEKLQKYLLMATKDIATKIATNLSDGSTQITAVAIVDALSELINMICAQVCMNFDAVGKMNVNLSQKIIIDNDQMKLKYVLKENQKAIYVCLATPDGASLGFIIVFSK